MNNYFDLSGQLAVVTGASTGLGLQMAKAFANQGANLVLLARRMNLLEENAKAITEEYGVEVLPFACDITDTEKVKAAVSAVMERFGKQGELDTCALFRASPASTYVTGQNIAVDGGYTCV